MRLTIAMGADFNYSDKVETLIKSITTFNQDCDFYLLNQDYPQEWFTVMTHKLAPFGSQIKDIKVDDQTIHHYQTLEHINYAAYLRYFIPELLLEDKVLYLDTDIIVTGSLSELFATDISDYPLAAVRDVWLEEQFNSGVMLINSRYFRDHQLTQVLLTETSQPNQRLSNGDQEILNRIFQNQWLALDTTYNAQVGMNIVLQPAGKPQLPTSPLPLVVHYASDQKPWILFTSTPLRDLWWDYYAMDWSAIYAKWSHPFPKKKKLFCLTNSDRLEEIEALLKALPEYEIHIAAYVFVSNRLKQLIRYPNCRIHQIVLEPTVEQLIEDMDAYLDINHGAEVAQILEKATTKQKPIFSFQSVSHGDYPNTYRFDDGHVQDMVTAIRQLTVN